ncbi:hypothetical protein L6452_08915 [Arctium lappa]|uniref:Uncharacterized protein n=1 Tax=Arctium lappa TaxID=4217 RepID=A0ACB9DJ21_ARCLA|nr:hypothetical protein L6452_08915 [Arctium lappa]
MEKHHQQKGGFGLIFRGFKGGSSTGFECVESLEEDKDLKLIALPFSLDLVLLLLEGFAVVVCKWKKIRWQYKESAQVVFVFLEIWW